MRVAVAYAGGELFYRIVDMGHFSEAYASAVMTALLRGVKALHDAGIVRTCSLPPAFSRSFSGSTRPQHG